MVSLFLLLGCNLSSIVDLFAALHELASASARTLIKGCSSRLLLKPRSGNELEVWRARENMTSQSPLVASMNLATTTKRLFESVKKNFGLPNGCE